MPSNVHYESLSTEIRRSERYDLQVNRLSDADGHFIAGFLAGEAHFGIAEANGGQSFGCLTVHMRRDDRPLLEMLAGALGIGYVRDQPAYGSTQPSASWHVGRLDDAVALAAWLDPELMRGRKRTELDVWLRAVDERRRARAAGVRAQPAGMEQLVAEFRVAREYRPGSFSPVGRPSRKPDTVDILRRWADDEPGPLSCTRYAAARQSEWPTRNTIVRWFGSWDAALRAAGLEDRRARAMPYRVGGAAGRKAHDAAQRERVLATLRYGINIHGSVPTAMQFFRWRLVGAPATPTQATVYRLFPGGWPAVLEALEESSPGLMSTVPH
jgi:hypothetical protein